MTRPTWEQRIARARELGEAYPFAAEVLRFYAGVASFQRELYSYVRSARTAAELATRLFREQLDLTLLLPRFPALLSLVQQAAPVPLATLATQLASEGPERWERLLRDFWNRTAEGADSGPEAFFARAFLQPWAEFLAEARASAEPQGTSPTCPVCSAEPVVAVLRPENYGARRSFICSLCAHEWEVRRGVCPGCGEDRSDALAVYTAAQFEHVRVDACDTCKTYIKTVDLTKNGLAVPVVDEIATLPLTLWAQERGYSKLQPNLMAV